MLVVCVAEQQEVRAFVVEFRPISGFAACPADQDNKLSWLPKWALQDCRVGRAISETHQLQENKFKTGCV